MINKHLMFALPKPWNQKQFETPQIGIINFLVGPNGSGKSKFAETLHAYLGNARMLGTERLYAMGHSDALSAIVGRRLAAGFAKKYFTDFKKAGQSGSGIDTFVLLEERMELRIQVEATLSHLFNRRIILEWDSGNVVPKAVLGETSDSYRLDLHECHGIQELLVLLTHLYNDEHPYLIIDEPELNLHPQYQAFFMQEVRKVAGDPNADSKKKAVFLVTHSPFILDFRSVEDVKSVISFNLNHSVPNHILNLDPAATAKLSLLVPRLNVHHKQLFFSDNPIFVEGILDAQIIGTMQEVRGVSVAGAGSCIIDAGGCEEVNGYLDLCLAFSKSAYFLYDLDSLFGGNLRACVRGDGSVQNFLLTAGVGHDFSKYCGQLDAKLTEVVEQLFAANTVPQPLTRLIEFLNKLGPRIHWNKKTWSKARVAVMTAISRERTAVIAATSQTNIEEIEGRLKQIVDALKQRNILLLPGGTLERYLPKYAGDHYELTNDAKRKAVKEEIEEMSKAMTATELAARYGDLYEAVRALPSKVSVDVEQVLRAYLSHYIHDLQAAIVNNPTWILTQLQAHLNIIQQSTAKVFSVQELNRESDRKFSAVITIAEMLGQEQKRVRVTHQTNAGMGDFKIELA
jgi:predicted ATPase